jgi:hypothetical protein
MELTRNIKLGRLQWLGHVLRTKNERAPKKGLKGCMEGEGWLEGPEEDANGM